MYTSSIWFNLRLFSEKTNEIHAAVTSVVLNLVNKQNIEFGLAYSTMYSGQERDTK